MAAPDLQHMRSAIALAQARLGSTWPNPVVGCVIARGDRVLAEAATGPGGTDSAASRLHAEEQALTEAGDAARGAVAYVTLEPCARRSSGRSSCTDRLIAAGVSRVVAACGDPSALAAGQGLERLAAAGVEVETGLLADEAAGLYRGYRHWLETGRPLVEAAEDGAGFDAPFVPETGENLLQALNRFGSLGYTRLWVERGEMLEQQLRESGLLK
jgi:diaminohydroxyphosphoribosylaminopyrimidine deaminase/5-amino-6-(5-phosphoribosylamino)uracil reductase